MNRLDTTRKVFTFSAGIVVSIYLSLAVVAFFCATTHTHHHGHEKAHSPLCAWACQANSSVGLLTLETPAIPLLLALYFLSFLYKSTVSTPRICIYSRGPPIR